MFKAKRHNSKAQSGLEYAMVVTAIAVALIGIQLYVQRCAQARIKDTSDEISNYLFDPQAQGGWTVHVDSNTNTTVEITDGIGIRTTHQETDSYDNTIRTENIGG